MPEVFKTQRRVEFRETDMAGIVHFSNFFAYMEQSEHALLRSLGFSVINCEVEGQKISWPRVHAECNYRNAIKFEEMIDIHVTVKKIGTKSVTYGFNFFRDDTPVADGTITVACCLFTVGERPQAIPTPDSFVEKIRPYLVE